MTEPCIKEEEIQFSRDLVIKHEATFDFLQKSLDTIENNHLAHLQKSYEGLDEKMEAIVKELRESIDGLLQFKYKEAAIVGVLAVIGSFLATFLMQYLAKHL